MNPLFAAMDRLMTDAERRMPKPAEQRTESVMALASVFSDARLHYMQGGGSYAAVCEARAALYEAIAALAENQRAIEVIARLLEVHEGRSSEDARAIAAQMLHA